MRITRKMADDAAKKMASKQFDEKIKSLNSDKKILGDEIASAYIPKEIVDISKKYPSFFKMESSVSIRPEMSSGWAVIIPTSESIPRYYFKDFLVKDEEYKKARRIEDSIARLKSDKDNLTSRISDTLISLRTVDKINKEFPEALPFLDVSEKYLPSIQIDDLRNLFQ